MRKKFLILLLFIGLVAIAFGVAIICDISLTDEGTDITENVDYWAIDGQLHIDVTDPSVFKYLELEIAGGNNRIRVNDYNGVFVLEKTVSNGNNTVEFPSSKYIGLQIWFEPSESLQVNLISLNNKIPLGIQHIIIFILFGLGWSLLVIRVVNGSSLSLMQFINLKRYSYLLVNLVKKDFTTKYRRSLLGVVWSVLNPLLMAIVVSLVFSSFFKFSIEHFPVYYLTGSLIFTFISEASSAALGSIIGSSTLIKKVYIPKYIFPVEKCSFALINSMFSFVALIVIMPFLGVFPTPLILFSVIPLCFALIFSIGLGMILASLNVFFRDIGHLWGVWSVAWSFLTPIFYPAEILPENIKNILIFNPAYHYVEYFRQIMLYGTVPDLRAHVICMAFAFGALVIGLAVFKKTQDKFILYM